MSDYGWCKGPEFGCLYGEAGAKELVQAVRRSNLMLGFCERYRYLSPVWQSVLYQGRLNDLAGQVRVARIFLLFFSRCSACSVIELAAWKMDRLIFSGPVEVGVRKTLQVCVRPGLTV